MNRPHLEEQIRERRDQLHALVTARQGDFSDPDVMKLSMEIDTLIVEWQKQKAGQPPHVLVAADMVRKMPRLPKKKETQPE